MSPSGRRLEPRWPLLGWPPYLRNASNRRDPTIKTAPMPTMASGPTLNPGVSSSKNLRRPALEAGRGALFFLSFFEDKCSSDRVTSRRHLKALPGGSGRRTTIFAVALRPPCYKSLTTHAPLFAAVNMGPRSGKD